MNKTLLGLLFSLPLLFGACNKLPTQPPQPTPTQSPDTQSQVEASEFATTISNGGSMRCTTNKTDGSMKADYAIKDKKMRMEGMSLSNAQQQTDGIVINDGTYIYIWQKGKTDGIKTKVPTKQELEQIKDDAQKMTQQIPDLTQENVRNEYQNQGFVIHCDPAEILDTEFIPPAEIKFTDTSAMMKGAMEVMQEQSKNLSSEDKEKLQQFLNQMDQE